VYFKQNIKFIILGLVGFTAIFSFYLIYSDDQQTTTSESSNLQNTTEEKTVSIYEQAKKAKTNNLNANKILSDCGNLAICTVEALQNLAKMENQKTVLATVGNISSAYIQMNNPCHTPAHHLGAFLYGYTGNLTEVLLFFDPTCAGGFYHGIMENYFNTEIFFGRSSPEEINTKTACALLSEVPYIQPKIQCVHGVGHGLVIAYNYDIFSVLKRCDEFETPFSQHACYQGVFMENIGGYFENNGGAFDQKDIFYPCNKVDEKYAGDCYQFHALYILHKLDFSVEDSFIQCDKITPQKFVSDCYYGVGQKMWSFSHLDMEKLKSICLKGDSAYQSYCFAGVEYMVVEQEGTKRAFEFCKIIPEKFKINCYDKVGQWIQSMTSSKDEIEKECSQVETQEQYETCITANPEKLLVF